MSIFDTISSAKSAFLIAEIGSNHNGDFDLALRLMDVAQRAGANAVKFQSFLADQLVSTTDPSYAMLKRLELPQEWYPRLQRAAAERGLVFFSTASNERTLGWLVDAGVELFKIASPNLTHLPLIRRVGALGHTAIMSTGMASLMEIDEAVQTYTSGGNQKLCLLYCVSEYPAKPEHLQLRNIPSLQAIYHFPVGFSDHTLDIGSAIAAVTLGARLIEKHLTLNRSMDGPDHHYALQPDEFMLMARNIRDVEAALGDGHRHVLEDERVKAIAYRRSLHAARHLAAGTVLSAEDISVIRPDDGLHPRVWNDVIGMKLTRSLKAQQPITWSAFKETDGV